VINLLVMDLQLGFLRWDIIFGFCCLLNMNDLLFFLLSF
jgi:hypothetical protein